MDNMEKTIRTMIITCIVLVLIAAGIAIAIHNSSSNTIVGIWQATAEDGTKVEYNFTKDYENASTKETIYYLTVTDKNGKKEEEKGTYNISNDTVITFRPLDDSVSDSTTATFKINKNKLDFKYTVNFEESNLSFTKVEEKKKK